MEHYLYQLREQIIRDAENCNPDSPEMVYDCIELKKLLDALQELSRKSNQQWNEAQSRAHELARLWKPFYEEAVILERTLLLLGSCSQECTHLLAEETLTHLDKHHIARRSLVQIRELKNRLEKLVFEKPSSEPDKSMDYFGPEF